MALCTKLSAPIVKSCGPERRGSLMIRQSRTESITSDPFLDFDYRVHAP